jgi:hypothetical protein
MPIATFKLTTITLSLSFYFELPGFDLLLMLKLPFPQSKSIKDICIGLDKL